MRVRGLLSSDLGEWVQKDICFRSDDFQKTVILFLLQDYLRLFVTLWIFKICVGWRDEGGIAKIWCAGEEEWSVGWVEGSGVEV